MSESEGFEPRGPGDGSGGSIAQTLAGNADLDIGEVLGEAWESCSGVRSIILILAVLMILISLFVAGVLSASGLDNEAFPDSMIFQLAGTAAVNPLIAGMFMIALRHLQDEPSELRDGFDYYSMALPIVAIALLQSIAIGFGMILLILPGIYLAIALSLALPLKVEHDLDVLDALTMSLKLVNAKFVNVAVLAIVGGLLLFVGFATIIGWLITFPWVVMIYTITYRQLVGIQPTDDGVAGRDSLTG